MSAKNSQSLSGPLSSSSNPPVGVLAPMQNSYQVNRTYENRGYDERKKYTNSSKQYSVSSTSKKAPSEKRWFRKFSRPIIKKEEKPSSVSSCSKNKMHVSKPTSWTFVQPKLSGSDLTRDRRTSVGAEIRSHRRKMSKQQVFSMLPASALPPANPGPGKENESSLRQLLLVKQTPLKRRHLASDTHLSGMMS